MRDGSCPKCSSKRVHVGSEAPWGVRGAGVIPISELAVAETVRHVCVDCGYVESYVADRSKLRRIAEEWPAAAGPMPTRPARQRIRALSTSDET